jgi:glycosyltransferase involved in cell wall biosynthesis
MFDHSRKKRPRCFGVLEVDRPLNTLYSVAINDELTDYLIVFVIPKQSKTGALAFQEQLGVTVAIDIRVDKDQFARRLREKCVTVYNSLGSEAMAVDLDTAQAFRASVGNPEILVGVVGRIKWIRKGQEVLIKAAAILSPRFPAVRYAIVGSASPGNEEHLARLQKLIRENNLEQRVIFTGDIEETRDIYAALDVTVVPSILPEPFGRVVMESMAAGTPVIGSRCGGIPEQIVDGVTGLLFSPGNEEDLANALSILIADKAMRLRMGREGQRYIQSKFDDSGMYMRCVEIFGTGHVPVAETELVGTR